MSYQFYAEVAITNVVVSYTRELGLATTYFCSTAKSCGEKLDFVRFEKGGCLEKKFITNFPFVIDFSSLYCKDFHSLYRSNINQSLQRNSAKSDLWPRYRRFWWKITSHLFNVVIPYEDDNDNATTLVASWSTPSS